MRVVVVGGGVIGLCCAYSLAERGMEVTVLDAGDGPGTSSINAGMIVPSHIIPLAAPGMVGVGLKMMLRPRSPFWIRPSLNPQMLRWCACFARSCKIGHVERSKALLLQLNLASKEAYLEFAARLQGFQVHQKGLLMIARTEAALREEKHVGDQVRAMGLPVQEVRSGEIESYDPGVRIDAVGGVHYLADCHFAPAQFLAGLRRKLYELGAKFEAARVVRLEPGKVHTSQEALDSDRTVLATGAWTASLLPMLLQAGKGYSFEIDSPPERPSIPAILMEGRVAVTPMPKGVRFGGTMEIGPPDTRIDAGRVRGIAETIPRYYPAFASHLSDTSVSAPNVGLRPCTPDGLPYLGYTKRIKNVIVATGHAMMGMSLAPITGRLVAELAAGREPSIPIDLLDPDRFA